MRSQSLISLVLSVLVSGLLIGCGGGDPAPVQSTDTGTNPSPAPPAAPETPVQPSFGGAAPVPPAASGGTNASNNGNADSTPDAAFKQYYSAILKLEFEELWDSLPSSYQSEINGVFQEFGKQVDPELWDKSFNLLTRYVSVMQTKQDMVYETPEAQAAMGMMQLSAGRFGVAQTDLATPEKAKEISAPLTKAFLTILNSELSKTSRLKSFDGRVFMAKTVSPVAENLKELVQLVLAEIPQTNPSGELPQIKMAEKYLDSEALLSSLQVTVKNAQETKAVVEVTIDGETNEYKMEKVDGKWVPEMLSTTVMPMLGVAKDRVPMIAQKINSVKERVMPALEQIEPLIADLQKANKQEDFNLAYAAFNSEAPQLIANAVGMPGLSVMMGGGAVQISPVTIEVSEDLSEERLGTLITELESFTDEPEKTISLPKRSGGMLTIQMTPVPDPQAFSNKLASGSQLASSVDYDSTQRIIRLELKPLPAEPETTDSEAETQ